MFDDFVAEDLGITIAIFEQIQRIAPELPEDTGFSFEDRTVLRTILLRLQEIPDAAGTDAVAAAIAEAQQA